MKYPISEKDIFPYRPKPFYFITTTNKEELSYDVMYKSLFDLKQNGFGGIVLFNKPQNGFNEETYLSEEFFEMVENTAKACRDLGLVMFINNALDFPPGAVGGKIKKIAPHLKQKRIMLENDSIVVKDVEWGFPAFEEKESSELFVKLVYEEYKKHVGQYFGNPIVGFFSDNDNRHVEPWVLFNPESEMRNFFPWCSDFEESFKDTYGYEIMPYMKDIIKRKDIPQAVDYWEHSGTMMHRWFKRQYEWIQENNLLLIGHTTDSSPFLYEDTPRTSPLTEGRFSDIQRYFDYAGTDHELYAVDCGKHIKEDLYYTPEVVWGQEQTTEKMTNFSQIRYDLRPKQAEAAAVMHGKKGVMCEMFAASNFAVEPKTLLHISAFQLMQGVNLVVTHEYHHRFRGETKYFAPPDFSPASMHKYSLGKINDEIAKRAYMLSKGERVHPVVLIDPTEAVWRNILRTEEYFEAFEKLNRMPFGFTICDTKHIIEGNFGFKVAVLAGYELKQEELDALNKKGITVISEKELDKIYDIITDCDVSYKGEGTPHFVRRIIDGEEFTFIANIEQTTAIKGEISAYGKTKEITLYPGDIRYISENYDDIEEFLYSGNNSVKLSEEAEVSYDRLNVLPIEYWRAKGETVVKTEDSESLSFEFNVSGKLGNITLCIPYDIKDIITSVTLNDNKLNYVKGIRFQEDYMLYPLGSLEKGKYIITLFKNAPIDHWHHISIEGDFDVSVNSEGKSKLAIATYNLSLFAPESAEVTLSERRNKMSMEKSWALQGQPFYSGGVTYKFKATAEKAGEYILYFPNVRDVCDVYVNNKFYNRLIKPPYEEKVFLNEGENEIEVTVYNLHANQMEQYLEPSGITEGCYLEKL